MKIQSVIPLHEMEEFHLGFSALSVLHVIVSVTVCGMQVIHTGNHCMNCLGITKEKS